MDEFPFCLSVFFRSQRRYVGLFKSVGCESSTNAYSVKGSTPFIDALFATRYGIYPDQQPADGLKEQIGRQAPCGFMKINIPFRLGL